MAAERLGKATRIPSLRTVIFAAGEAFIPIDREFHEGTIRMDTSKGKEELEKQYEARQDLYEATFTRIENESHNRPIALGLWDDLENKPKKGKGSYRLFKGLVYVLDDSDYSDEEVILLIQETEYERTSKFEAIKSKLAGGTQNSDPANRERVPEDVRIAVWRRDQGKCSHCGSKEFLEYDHIVPVSKGGSNTARNIELLCEKCNRLKRDNIR